MVTVVIKYALSEHSKWKAVFDELTAYSCACGLIGSKVAIDPNNNQTVVMENWFRNVDNAKTFLQSEQLKQAMKKLVSY